MPACGDCYWLYHVPNRFAEIKKNGEFMCTNRNVKIISVSKELLACSLFREQKALYPRKVLDE